MPASHDNRLHALEMLLRSMRTKDPDLQERYERLSEAWLALAQNRERLDWPEARTFTRGPTGTWRSIDSAPREQEILVTAAAWGPRIWLRDDDHAARGRWRREAAPSVSHDHIGPSRDARWEDLDGEALAFAPTEWREIDA